MSAELGMALAGLTLFIALATAICSRKSPHADEVMDAEVAVNLVQIGKPVSYAFTYATPGDIAPSFWPAYDYALAAWLNVLGVSRPAVISFYITVVAIVSLMILGAVRRSGLIRSARDRLLLTFAIPLLPAVLSVYSKNRYDAMGMLGLAMATFALTVKHPLRRHVLLICGGLFAGAGGLDVVIASGPLAMLLVLSTGRRFISETAVYLGCVAGGLGLTFLRMYANGTLDDFFECVRLTGVNAREAARGASVRLRMVEPVLVAILVSTALIDRRRDLFAATGRVKSKLPTLPTSLRTLRRSFQVSVALKSPAANFHHHEAQPLWAAVVLGVGAAILIPTCIGSVGHYNPEYTWLSTIPVFVAAAVAASHARTVLLRVVSAVALLLVAMSGLPTKTLYLAAEWAEQDYRPIEQFVADRIDFDDVVFASWPLSYPVKRSKTPAFIGGAFHRMTNDQKSAVTVAFFAGRENGVGHMDPTIEEAINSFGSDWTETDRLLVPRGTLRMRLLPAPKSTYCYEVRVFRRTKEVREALNRQEPTSR